MYRNALLGGAAAIAVAWAAGPAAAQETINLTAATGHPEVFLWVKHLKETFIPTVDAELAKTGKVKINWTQGYGGTIVKLGSETEAFQQIRDRLVVGRIIAVRGCPLVHKGSLGAGHVIGEYMLVMRP